MKTTYTLPAIDTEDTKMYPDGVGELAESKFISSIFQMTYYNRPEIGTRFLVDPYRKRLYYQHYPAPKFLEIFTHEGEFMPSVLPNGQIKDAAHFSQTSF
jgi:hypothetical protein